MYPSDAAKGPVVGKANIQGVPELNVHILHVNSIRKIESKIIIPKICQRHIYRVISHLSRPIRKFNLRGGKYIVSHSTSLSPKHTGKIQAVGKIFRDAVASTHTLVGGTCTFHPVN